MDLSMEQVASRLRGWLGRSAEADGSGSYGVARLGLALPTRPERQAEPVESRPSLLPLVARPGPVAEPTSQQPAGQSPSSPPPQPRSPQGGQTGVSRGVMKTLLGTSRSRRFLRHSRLPAWTGPFTRRSFKLPVGLAYRLRVESHRQDRYLWDLAAEALERYLDEMQLP